MNKVFEFELEIWKLKQMTLGLSEDQQNERAQMKGGNNDEPEKWKEILM